MNSKYERHQEVSRIQARQKLANCAMLAAYIHGQPGGWYGIAAGHIDGFANDYAIVHCEPGNLAMHPIRAFYLGGEESELQELEEVRTAVKNYNEWDELPLVTTLTAEEIEAAAAAVREAISEESPEDVEEWLRELCDQPASDFSCCNWGAVVAAVSE